MGIYSQHFCLHDWLKSRQVWAKHIQTGRCPVLTAQCPPHLPAVAGCCRARLSCPRQAVLVGLRHGHKVAVRASGTWWR